MNKVINGLTYNLIPLLLVPLFLLQLPFSPLTFVSLTGLFALFSPTLLILLFLTRNPCAENYLTFKFIHSSS